MQTVQERGASAATPKASGVWDQMGPETRAWRDKTQPCQMCVSLPLFLPCAPNWPLMAGRLGLAPALGYSTTNGCYPGHGVCLDTHSILAGWAALGAALNRNRHAPFGKAENPCSATSATPATPYFPLLFGLAAEPSFRPLPPFLDGRLEMEIAKSRT